MPLFQWIERLNFILAIICSSVCQGLVYDLQVHNLGGKVNTTRNDTSGQRYTLSAGLISNW